MENVSPEDPALIDGQKAYALRQAHVRSSLHKHFLFLWRDVPSWIREANVPKQDEGDAMDVDDEMDDDDWSK
jgi:hypothetical protein